MNRTDALYQTGRYYQGQIRYDKAIAAYQQVLQANPDHVDAHNALAVIHASLGQHELAERHFKEALALADVGYLYNNLGYAYLLQGRDAEALAALERAKALSPNSERVAVNLSVAAFRVGEQMAAAPSLVAAAQTERHEARSGEVSCGDAGVDPGTMRLVRLEVANGIGIRGMAKQTAHWLSRQGFPPARLTNHKPYRQAVTEIQYVHGLESEALRLSAALPGNAVLVAAGALQRGVQVRLVIGRDMGVERSRLVAEAEPVRLAQHEEGSVLRP